MRWPIATAAHETPVAPESARYRPRLAMLCSPGFAYLRGLICAASIRQGFDVELFTGSCANYEHMLADRSSDLCLFRPNIVLLAVQPTYVSGRSGGGRARTMSHPAKERLGAALVRNTVLPVLLSLCDSEATASLSLLGAIEGKLCSLRIGRVELSSTKQTLPELLIQARVLPFWRRRKPQSTQTSRNAYCAGGAFAELFGVSYGCIVVDVKRHPWIEDRDVASFLLRWNENRRSENGRSAPNQDPDSFLFVDHDPLAVG